MVSTTNHDVQHIKVKTKFRSNRYLFNGLFLCKYDQNIMVTDLVIKTQYKWRKESVSLR